MEKAAVEKGKFDREATSWDNEERTERARQVAKAIDNKTAAGGSGLEVGSGTGLVSFFLKDHFDRIKLIDTSEGMIGVLNDKIKAAGLTHFEANTFDLLTDGSLGESFDTIYSSMVMHHINDLDAMLSACKQHLKPGGRLCIVDLDKEDGSFHLNEPGFSGHNGFDQGELAITLEKIGFTAIQSEIFFRGVKDRKRLTVPYALFIMVGSL